MAIPVGAVKPLQVPGGTHTYVFNGPVGTTGPVLFIDLTDIPLRLRQDTNFQDMLYVVFKSLDDDISAAGPAVLTSANFNNDGDNTNAYLDVEVTAVAGTEECMILVEPRHTIAR
jgi:hypothetical protein